MILKRNLVALGLTAALTVPVMAQTPLPYLRFGASAIFLSGEDGDDEEALTPVIVSDDEAAVRHFDELSFPFTVQNMSAGQTIDVRSVPSQTGFVPDPGRTDSGRIFGFPNVANTYHPEIRVLSSEGVLASKTVEITVVGTLEVTTPQAVEGEPNTVVDFTPALDNALGDDVLWTISPPLSELPSWINFDPQTGQIHGTPPGAVTIPDIVLTVTDQADGASASTDPFDIVVGGAGGTLTATLLSGVVSQVNDMVVGSDGSFFTTGEAKASSGSTPNAVTAKYNADGTIAWRKFYTGTGYTIGHGITIGSDGFIYTSVQGKGSGTDAFLMKHNASTGALVWTKRLSSQSPGQPYTSQPSDVPAGVVASGSNVVEAVTVPAGAHEGGNYVLASYTSAGAVSWKKNFGDATYSQEVLDIAGGPGGSVYVAGYEFTSGYADARNFVAKHGADGALIWKQSFDSVTAYHRANMALDVGGDGSVAVAYQGRSTTPGYSSVIDVAVSKFSSSGSLQWHRVTGLGTALAEAVEIDGNGSVYVAGRQLYTPLVVKISAAGDEVWAATLNVGENAALLGLALGPEGIFVGGSRGSLPSTESLVAILPSEPGNSPISAVKNGATETFSYAKVDAELSVPNNVSMISNPPSWPIKESLMLVTGGLEPTETTMGTITATYYRTEAE